MNNIMTVGNIKPTLLNSLETRYQADVRHKYKTVKQLSEAGMSTFMKGEYNTLLIGVGVPADARARLTNAAGKRAIKTAVIVITTDLPSFSENWIAITPDTGVDALAEIMECPPRRGEPLVIIAASTKGGVGKSSVAVNTAVMLAQMGHRVALLEDDWTSRSIQMLLGIPDGPYTSANLVADILANDGYVSPEIVKEYLIDAFGVKALIGPPSLLTEFPITPDMAKDVLAVIGRELSIDVVVIDAPPDFVQTSCFTYGLLNNTENQERPPLILVPVAPETFLLRSVDDTVNAITFMKQPKERIWPVVNCTRPTHDPESLRNSDVLWREPAGIVNYCPAAQFVGDTQTPLVSQANGSFLSHFWHKSVLGVASIRDVKKSYAQLCYEITPLIAENS